MEILANIGVDGRILLAQIVNFLILLFVLQRFVYRPLLAFLEERSKKIEQGLKDAEQARKQLSEAEAKQEALLVAARAEGQEMVKKAESVAARAREELLDTARSEAAKIAADAKRSIEEEKAKMFMEAKQELAGLVIAATEKVLVAKLDSEIDRELVKKEIGN